MGSTFFKSTALPLRLKLVYACLDTLTELGSPNRHTVAWVPGYRGCKGSKEVHLLGRGSSKAHFGLETLCGITKTTIEICKKQMLNKS